TERANRLRFDADRRRFVLRRCALRATLGAYLGTAGREVAFSEGAHGKLFLDPRRHRVALRFNTSHAHELAVIGISANREVGVDIERYRSLPDIAGLGARCFPPREQSTFAAVPEPRRLETFFGAWTLKEAYFKACGEGLTRSLDRVEVTIGAEGPVRLIAVLDRAGDEDRWTLHRLVPGEGYVGALAVEGRGYRLRTWCWRRA